VVASGDIDTDFPVKAATGISDGTMSAPPSPPGVPARPGVPVPSPAPVVIVVPEPGTGKPGKVKVRVPRDPPTQARLDGTVGTGDAVVNLSSFSGSLHLRKR
jgi:hypothetical protein